MKQTFLIKIILFLSTFYSQSQSIECIGNYVKFPLNDFKTGTIQWQFSKNKSDWINVTNGNSSELRYIINETGYFRAKVTSGSCEYYSDTTYIIASDSSNCRQKTSIGAIRWDGGWVGDVSPISVYTQKQLSPEKFRFRTPFFATIHKPDSITITTTQATMDQEIAYAKNAGIDYWLYGWFPASSGFASPLNKHLSSSHKDDVKFSYILHSQNWKYLKNELTITLNRMKESNYMMIYGKPLVFFMHNTWTLADIDFLRTEAKKAGLPELYLVFMNWTGESSIQECAEFGGQASSAYCNWGDGGISYLNFTALTEAKWDTHKNINYGFIPFVTTGWDPRPIIEYYHGLSEADSISISNWYPKPAEDHWVQTATAEEVAVHLKAGLDWVKNNPFYSYPNTVIMYAWNECSEGGFIIPVVETNISAINYGTKRLDTIKAMLDDYWKKE